MYSLTVVHTSYKIRRLAAMGGQLGGIGTHFLIIGTKFLPSKSKKRIPKVNSRYAHEVSEAGYGN